MVINYSTYKVKIRDIEFTTDDGQVFANTARISFFDDLKKEVAYLEMGYLDTEDIYKMIDESKPVNLNDCYVENFSLSVYRKSRGLGVKDLVKVHCFSAKNAFFDAHKVNDFSYADFGDEDIIFEKAHFINGDVSFHGSQFGKGKLNFSYVLINKGDFDFSGVVCGEGECSFKNSVFKKGETNFQDARFGKGELSFVNTDFGNGDAIFVNTNFSEGDVTFKVARFGDGKVDFQYAKFGKGDISFERTEFGNGRVDFRKVEFNMGKINFNRAVFGNGEITFEGSQMEGKMTFKRTLVGEGDLNFEIVEFDKAEVQFEKVNFTMSNASFYNSRFNILSLKSCRLDNYVDLRLQHCKYLDMSETIVRDIVDIKCTDFNVDIHTLDISGMKLLGKIYIDWKINNVKELIDRQKGTDFRTKADQFRILKQNFNSTGQYDDEDKAYIYFKRFEQKAILHEAISKNKHSAVWQYPLHWLKTILFDKMGLYATSPFRVLLSVIFVYCAFSIIFIAFPFFTNATLKFPEEPTSFIDRTYQSFYYTGITFFTVGYGDILPTGTLRIFSDLCAFFGVFMMSYFTVAFARKILR